MSNLIFASYANEKEDLLANYLLAKSIRDFSGGLSDIQLRVYIPESILMEVQPMLLKFRDMNVSFRGYPLPNDDFDYFFKPAAALAAEKDICNGTVIWFDRHMLVLGPCADLILNETESFAYRPPHLQLLGSSYDLPPDELWETLYDIAEIDTSSLFPVYSVVDRKKIRSYFFAGHFSFRAESGLMREWVDLFNHLKNHSRMQQLLKDKTVRVFLHQIALTITVLKKCKNDQLKALPLYYGYPAHLYEDIPGYYQAGSMSDLNTAFLNSFYQERDVLKIPISGQLQSWILSSINEFQ